MNEMFVYRQTYNYVYDDIDQDRCINMVCKIVI